MTREDLDHLVDVTRAVPDELEIVREPPGDEGFTIVDAREGGEDVPVADDEVHASPISPEMIGLPAPSSDLLPRRRRFLLRTRPAVTEPHAEPHLESHAQPHLESRRESHAEPHRELVDGAPAPITDRPDLAGFRLPGTRAPRPAPAAPPRVVNPAAPPRVVNPPAAVVHRASTGPQPVVESGTETSARPDRRARRRTRRARVVVVSCVALALLALAIVVLLVAVVAR